MIQFSFWGDPVYVRPGKRGRPPFERTPENANKVSMLLALGWSNARIAGCIIDPRTGKSISEPTLKRHFRSELQVRAVARDQLEAWRFMQTKALADEGNVSALKELGKMLERNDLMGVKRRHEKVQKDGADEAIALGKKEAAQRAAEAPAADDSGWGEDLEFPGLAN
ncbi:hypothetical protein ATO6_15405 [Oceanicola sp. 22II-s10i]|nr:hypothetical protein ATO6_15405 [Oceanicola sp. 22II-s10i]